MPTRYLLPSPVDIIRAINANAVDNLLAAQPSYSALPSLYQRAYMLVHQTGAVRLDEGFAAPLAKTPDPVVNTLVDPRVSRARTR